VSFCLGAFVNRAGPKKFAIEALRWPRESPRLPRGRAINVTESPLAVSVTRIYSDPAKPSVTRGSHSGPFSTFSTQITVGNQPTRLWLTAVRRPGSVLEVKPTRYWLLDF
jgi:hypothetical protein